MDLRRLTYFVEVADCQSFTRAGGRLAIAQSALSRQIRDLEEELGIDLLHRTGRGVQLTDAGEQFLGRARKLLQDADSLLADTKAMNDCCGTVSLGVLPSISQLLLTPLLNRVRRERPGLQVRVMEGFSGHIGEWLLSGRLDLAILYCNSPAASTLLADKLLSEDMYLIGAPGDPVLADESVPLATAAALPLVLPGRPHGLRLLLEKTCAKAGVQLRVDIEVDALSTMKGLVAHGTGYTILPISAVQQELEGGRLSAARIGKPSLSRDLMLASSRQRPHTRASQEVSRILRKQVADLVSAGDWVGRV
ncbi:MAG: LysR substrate-binding domain-containing protein [Parvibaculaceae bacterium]